MRNKNKKGFTLIELMVVIAVIAILATIALFGINRAQASARDTQRQQIMNGMRTALERYYGDNQQYPNTGAFQAMYASLSTGGYQTTPPADPGCGQGSQTMPAGSADWGVATCTGVTYDYNVVGSGSGYSLVLRKEGGGSSVFNSPQ